MSRALNLTDDLFEYLVAHSNAVDDCYRAIQAETEEKTGGAAGMQIGPDQYAFMRMLVSIARVERAVEVGTFTGSSAAAIAGGLAPGGRLICCDISEEWTAIGRRHWEEAGLADRIDLRIGPALDTLSSLSSDPAIDFAFIDADKPAYVDYYEAIVPRLSPGGLLLADNVLWSGRVIDPDDDEANTEAIRRFNEHVTADGRVEQVMLSVGDGITLCRKR